MSYNNCRLITPAMESLMRKLKYLLPLLAVLFLADTVLAQSNPLVRAYTTASATAGSTIPVIGSGIRYHKLLWYKKAGTVSTCQVLLQQSEDESTWSTLISAQTCTSSGSVTAATSGIANYVRINPTTKTGAGEVTFVYLGYLEDPTGAGDLATEATLADLLAAVEEDTSVGAIPTGAASGGASPYSHLSNGSTVEYTVKASAGQVYKLDVTNTLSAAMYVRLYNLTDADCTSATGIVARFIIPAATTGQGGSFSFPVGKEFSTGITMCVTSNISDTGNTAVTTSVVAVNIDYD